METYQAGNSGDYAEVIVDFRKKDIKLINPKDKSEFKKNRFEINIFNSLSLIITALIAFIIYKVYLIIHPSSISMLWFWGGIIFINYVLGVIFYPEYNNWFDKWTQKIFTGYLLSKKVIIVRNIKKKIWQLPPEYEFKNNYLSYKQYGDYKKLRTKIHIRPKDYYTKSIWGKLVKQTEEWEAFFYFSRVPKKGKMIIEFN